MSPVTGRDYEHENIDHETPLLPTTHIDRPEKKKSKHLNTTTAIVSIAALASLACLAVVAYSGNTSSLIKSLHLQEVAPAVPAAGNSNVTSPGVVNGTVAPGDEDLPICNDADGSQCANRILGFCYERVPCRSMAPTVMPTAGPTTTEDCDPLNPPCSSWVLGICVAHHTCEMNIGEPTSLPTAKPTTLSNCDPTNPPCVSRAMGICWSYADCKGDVENVDNSTDIGGGMPSSVPTPKPSTTGDCDPLKPPCKRDFLSFCYEFYPCANEGNHDSYPGPELNMGTDGDDESGEEESDGTCDPDDPPCKKDGYALGICWDYEECDESGHIVGYNSTENEGQEGHYDEDDYHYEKQNREEYMKNHDGMECDPEDPPCEHYDFAGICTNPEECTEDGKFVTAHHERGHKDFECDPDDPPCKPDGRYMGVCWEYEECTPEGHFNHTDVGDEDKDEDDKVEFHFNLDLNGQETDAPTPEPTTIYNCDPDAPPCKTWFFGVCATYQKCYGIHTTPANMTWDDDREGTDGPTPMPVPFPTINPTERPTVRPTTAMPTVDGFTFSPTISMMPTVEETHGPTQFHLCDPEKPPCDNYFFGVCLGVRYCAGSHEPTPNPTAEPTHLTDFPTSVPTTAYPTPFPTLGTPSPTEVGETNTPTAGTFAPTTEVTLDIPNNVVMVPTDAPTLAPENQTLHPSPAPTVEPTFSPTASPTLEPSQHKVYGSLSPTKAGATQHPTNPHPHPEEPVVGNSTEPEAPAPIAPVANATQPEAPAPTKPEAPVANATQPEAPAPTEPEAPVANATQPEAPAPTEPEAPVANATQPEAPVANATQPEAPAPTEPEAPVANATQPGAPAPTEPEAPVANSTVPSSSEEQKELPFMLNGTNLMAEGIEIVKDLKGARKPASAEAAMLSDKVSDKSNNEVDTDPRHFDYEWLRTHPSFLKEEKAKGIDTDARHFDIEWLRTHPSYLKGKKADAEADSLKSSASLMAEEVTRTSPEVMIDETMIKLRKEKTPLKKRI